MKSNVPWSIKGIDPDARDAAKRAARAAGMTLGEWLNQQIFDASSDDQIEDRPDPGPPLKASPITLDHLRELVASLNRLNDRLQHSERSSQEAITGLNNGLTSALERIRAVEMTRSANSTDALIGRIERIESGGNRQSIEGLKALEKALSRTLNQFEEIRDETLGRVEANETAISGLNERVDHLDAQVGTAIQELRQNIDEINTQIETTEASVSAVMEEARAAANSNDQEFIERTSNKMRILGNEIKRTSDRIQAIDSKMLKLTDRIDASEQRSAEGISSIAKTVSALTQELTEFDQDQQNAVSEARQVIETVSHDADDRLATLKRSFDAMMMRIEGIADGENAVHRQALAGPAPEPTAPALREEPVVEEPAAPPPAPAARTPEPEEPAAIDETADEVPPEPPHEANAPSDEDFDAIFGEPLAQDPDSWFDDPLKPEPEAATHDQGTGDQDTEEPEADNSRPPIIKPEESLTPKQKVILAARARRKRMQDQAFVPPRDEPDDLPEPAAPAREDKPLRARDTRPAISEDYDDEDERGETDRDGSEPGMVEKLRRKYSSGKEESSGLPVLPLIVFAVIVVLGLGGILLRDAFRENVSAIDQPARTSGQPVTGPTTGESEADPASLLERAMQILPQAQTPEERTRGLELLRRAANRGYPPAQFQLAEFYRLGNYLPQDGAQARTLYREAAEGGNIASMHKLGSMYASGEGGDKNDFTALTWFEQAASYGYINSIYNLGLLYDPAVELEVADQILDSAPQAYYWYSLAERLGDPDAGIDADRLAETLPADQRGQIAQEVSAWMAQRPVPGAN